MTGAVTRRGLFARLRGGPPQLRPPWARAEDDFADRCTQCGDCLSVCPTGIVMSGHAGYPIVDFTLDGCTFCGACADACNAHCFDRSATAPWVLRAAIAASCVEARGVTCRMCLEACDASAIRFRPKLGGGATALVDDAACTGCGACVRICPVKAIAVTIPSRTPEIAS